MKCKHEYAENDETTRETLSNDGETCNNCGGGIEYIFSLNKLICDTCDKEKEGAM